MVQSTITRCEEPENKENDQTLFWQEFWKHKKHLENSGAYYHHCGNDDAISKFLEAREPDLSFTYCCMDPYYYPVGQLGRPFNKDPVSYHANYLVGYDAKVKRLGQARPDGYGWNITRFKDGVGGILDASSTA